jgi:tetratricopeptide (TPR) repeat protein
LSTVDAELEAMVAEDTFLERLVPLDEPVDEAPPPAATALEAPGAEDEGAPTAWRWPWQREDEEGASGKPAGLAEGQAPVEKTAPLGPPDMAARNLDGSVEPVPAAPGEPAEADGGAGAGILPSYLEEALEDVAPAPVPPAPGRHAESYLDEGNVYFNVGQHALAIERYTRAIELDPRLTAGYYNRGNAHTRAGQYDEALADYNSALELEPGDPDALNNRGMLHLYRANYEAAQRDFNTALQADPFDTTVMVNRGLAQLHSGNAGAALADFETAATTDPTDAAAHYGAAQASAALGNRGEALRRLREAFDLDPAYSQEAASDAKLALLQGDPEFLQLLRDAGGRR